MRKFPKENGQSLVEVIVALGVAVLVLLALAGVTVTSINNAVVSRNQSLATKYSQESMEEARKLRDTLPETVFFVNDSCNEENNPIAGTIFFRIRTCDGLEEDGDKKIITVTVETTWTDSKGEHKSELMTKLSNWN